jgi:hypothetical protein
VAQNCYSALTRLRNDTVRCLWVDAICINQEDDDERSAQVRMMDRVFARASRVIVDLGDETPGSRLLFDELQEAEEVNKLTGKYTRLRPNDRIVQELGCLYRRPWFSRIWVVQEVVANPNVTIMCGNCQSSWAALSSCDMGYSVTRVDSMEDPPILRMKSPYNLSEYKLPNGLWKILLDTRSLVASDPRDRVLAILSLLGPGLDIRDQLVDYSQSTEVIFTRVGKLLLSQVGLKLLTAARYGHVREMPSWVPDWSQKHYRCCWLYRDEDSDEDSEEENDEELIKYEVDAEGAASKTGQLERKSVENTDPRRRPKDSELFELQSVGQTLCALKVKGIRIGTVICLSTIFSFSNFDDAKHAMSKLLDLFHRGYSDEHLPFDILAGKCGNCLKNV